MGEVCGAGDHVGATDASGQQRLVSVAESRVADADCAAWRRRWSAKPCGPRASSRCRDPSRGEPVWAAGSLALGSTVVAGVLCGWLTVMSARQVSSLVPRSKEGRPWSSSGCVSMNDVVTGTDRKSSFSRTACRNGMLVAIPRIRNSASAQRARATAEVKSQLRQVSLTSMESK